MTQRHKNQYNQILPLIKGMQWSQCRNQNALSYEGEKLIPRADMKREPGTQAAAPGAQSIRENFGEIVFNPRSQFPL